MSDEDVCVELSIVDSSEAIAARGCQTRVRHAVKTSRRSVQLERSERPFECFMVARAAKSMGYPSLVSLAVMRPRSPSRGVKSESRFTGSP